MFKNKSESIMQAMTIFMLILSIIAYSEEDRNPSNQEKSSLEVTYVANEGFLISSVTKKVLIDALFKKVIPDYAAPSEEVLGKMETGRSPFDNINLILTTHNHMDHYDAQSVARCLKNNPRTVFLSTPQAVEDLKKNVDDFEAIRDRVRTLSLNIQSSAERHINGIKVKIFRTKHSGDRVDPQNYMYLVIMDGKKVFHEGDSEGSMEAFKGLGLEKEEIDIALVHFWFPLDLEGEKIIKEILRPKHVVLMHLPNRLLGDAPNKVEMVRKNYSSLTLFTKCMEKKDFN